VEAGRGPPHKTGAKREGALPPGGRHKGDRLTANKRGNDVRSSLEMRREKTDPYDRKV
jgi:hypothetical protein